MGLSPANLFGKDPRVTAQSKKPDGHAIHLQKPARQNLLPAQRPQARRGRSVLRRHQAHPPLAEALPEGFEIYETPNGQVYLRRIKPALIHPEEMALVKTKLAKIQSTNHLYLADAAGPVVTIHEAETPFSALQSISSRLLPGSLDDLSSQFAHFTPVMRFTLIDEAARVFAPERYCFRGSVEDWIPIGPPGPLAQLITRFFKHLGKESIYELY